MVTTAVIVSGYFAPLHEGHVAYITNASSIGDVYVIVNNDEALKRKKGNVVMPSSTREVVVGALRVVRGVVVSTSKDDTVTEDLIYLSALLRKSGYDRLVFFKGGDRTMENTPEVPMCEQLGIAVVFEPPNKLNSSTNLIKQISAPVRVQRDWGYWEVLYTPIPTLKVKKLVVLPEKALSVQFHNFREEFWFRVSGTGEMLMENSIAPLDFFSFVPVKCVHTVRNTSKTEVLEILEVQYAPNGGACIEEDIVRLNTKEI